MEHNIQTVSNFDLNQYLGTWYEIARLPMKHEPIENTDISAFYELQENEKVKVVNRSRKPSGEIDEAIGEATIVDAENAKLEVTFLPDGLKWIPFSKGDYWVLKIDNNYTTALVGEPNLKYLWILNRSQHLDQSVIDEYLAYAQSLGYELGDIIYPKHTQTSH